MSAKGIPTSGLRDRRKELGLSQQELAGIVGCSLSYVRLIERGYRPTTGHVFRDVLAALQTSEAPADSQGSAKTDEDSVRCAPA